MASTQEFRRRIKSVNNTKQITKAMEMVASVKMQKAQKSIKESRTYVQNSWNMLLKLAKLTLPENHPLLRPREIKKTAVIFITSNRGLCGSYNSDLFKKLISYCSNEVRTNEANSSRPSGSNNNSSHSPLLTSNRIDIIAVGKKSAEFVAQHKIGNLVAAFDAFENNIRLEDIMPISKISNDQYLKGAYDRVIIIYSHFVSSLKQVPVVKQILPLDQNHIDLPELWEQQTEIDNNSEYKFEPSADAIMETLLYRFIRMQIYGAILEANASEHSSRMVAMKNATDNAGNLIEDLTLTYNTIRQNSITNEIAEISAGAESMK